MFLVGIIGRSPESKSENGRKAYKAVCALYTNVLAGRKYLI